MSRCHGSLLGRPLCDASVRTDRGRGAPDTPKFVKPYLKNQKNDMADAEAIAEAASRPTMRFVEVKTVEQQGFGMIFRLRGLLVGQRTQTLNALGGHLAELGLVVCKGRENIDKLRTALEPGRDGTQDLPSAVVHMVQLCFQPDR